MWTYTHVAKQVILNKEQPFWDMDSLGAFLNCSKEQLERLQKGYPSGMRMFYKTFYINKDTKKIVPWSTSLRLREINAPVSFLKGFQNRLAVWFSGFPKHPANFAFMEGRNILKAAEEVKDGGVLIHVDLKDFFESHTSLFVKRRLAELFKERYGTDLDRSTLDTVVQICTRASVLPQGSACSPILTIILNYKLDEKLTELAARYGLTYVRYADDMYFTGNIEDKDILPFIEALGDAVHPFRINWKKVNVMRDRAYPILNGISVKHNVRYMPSTQSAKIAEVIKAECPAPSHKVLVGKNIDVLMPNMQDLNRDDVTNIVARIQDKITTMYPKISFSVKPRYFYIQSIKKCLGLNIVDGKVNYPRQKYNDLRLEAMLMGMQRAMIGLFKNPDRARAWLPNARVTDIQTFVLMYAGLNPKQKQIRNLVTKPYNRKIFNGKVAFVESVDPKKGKALKDIEAKFYESTTNRVIEWIQKLQPGGVR